jgi:CRISPR-associated protein Cas1
MKAIATGKSIRERGRPPSSIINSKSAWATRSELWRSRVERGSARRTKRAKPKSALILAGHGVSLRIHGGALEIQNGLTHYPQQREKHLFFRGDADLPERIILLDCDGIISFDVLSWLAEQKVSLIRIDWKGDIVCVAGTSGYSANPFRVQWQLETRGNPALRIEYCRSIISKKIETSIVTLEKSIRRSEKWERAMSVAYAALTRLDAGRTQFHYRIARIGSQLCSCLFPLVARHAD